MGFALCKIGLMVIVWVTASVSVTDTNTYYVHTDVRMGHCYV